jgi:hypothetical protein
MTQVFVSASGVGGGSLNLTGRGPGAISTMQASGEVYKLTEVSQFSGPWIQGTGSLAITAKANGEIWLENRNGIIMRLNAAQAGLTFSQGRYELYIQLTQ